MDEQRGNVGKVERNPFVRHNHIRVGQVQRDEAVIYLDVAPESTNVYGVVHGGAYFTMADCCAGLVACSDGRQYVTQDASVQFIHNITAGRATARGTVLNRGRRICLVEVRITSREGALLFSGVFSMYCTSA